MINTDSYGPVPKPLYQRLKRLNVTPAEWDMLTYIYESRGLPVNHAQLRRFIDNNSPSNSYLEPYPLDELDVLTA